MDISRIVIRLLAGVINRFSVLQNVQAGSGTQAASYLGSEGAGVKLTIYLHLVPRLIMSGFTLPFPHTLSYFKKGQIYPYKYTVYNMHTH
jgi:hypothetical protein